jgi:hypothetical protein
MSVDDLMRNLVDSTAIEFYIKFPGQTRVVAENGGVLHQPMSFDNAIVYVDVEQSPERLRLRQVLQNYRALRGSLSALLDEFIGVPTKIWSPQKNRWYI